MLTLAYNRATRRYHVARSGADLQDFSTRDQAEQYIIALRAPDLYAALLDLAQKSPLLASRAWRAAHLYLDGHVTRCDDNQFIIKSQTTPQRIYLVDPLITHCLHAGYLPCPDHQHGHAPAGPGGRNWCKHMLAAALLVKFGPIQPQELLLQHRGRALKQPASPAVTAFADGAPIEDDLLSHAALYRQRHGQSPPSRDALIGWVYR
jgi:hypothetical protein